MKSKNAFAEGTNIVKVPVPLQLGIGKTRQYACGEVFWSLVLVLEVVAELGRSNELYAYKAAQVVGNKGTTT